MPPTLAISTVKSSKLFKTQVCSTSMLSARSIRNSSTNFLPWIPRNLLFPFHSLLSRLYKSPVSVVQSRTMSLSALSILSSAAELGPGSLLPSEEAALSNINLSINTPLTTPWEEAPQLMFNDARTGPMSPHSPSNRTGLTRSGTFFLTV